MFNKSKFTGESGIENTATNYQRISICSNLQCNSIFLAELSGDMDEKNFLCPRCVNDIKNSHIVQCSCCQTIIDYIPAEDNEELIVVFVDNCEHCMDLQRAEWGFDTFFSHQHLL